MDLAVDYTIRHIESGANHYDIALRLNSSLTEKLTADVPVTLEFFNDTEGQLSIGDTVINISVAKVEHGLEVFKVMKTREMFFAGHIKSRLHAVSDRNESSRFRSKGPPAIKRTTVVGNSSDLMRDEVGPKVSVEKPVEKSAKRKFSESTKSTSPKIKTPRDVVQRLDVGKATKSNQSDKNAGDKSVKPTSNADRWIALRAMSHNISGNDIASYFAGLGLLNVFACVCNDESVINDDFLDFYLEFESSAAATLALLRQGEAIKGNVIKTIDIATSVESCWAKAIGVVWAGPSQLCQQRRSFLQDCVPFQLLLSNPATLQARWNIPAFFLAPPDCFFSPSDRSKSSATGRSLRRRLVADTSHAIPNAAMLNQLSSHGWVHDIHHSSVNDSFSTSTRGFIDSDPLTRPPKGGPVAALSLASNTHHGSHAAMAEEMDLILGEVTTLMWGVSQRIQAHQVNACVSEITGNRKSSSIINDCGAAVTAVSGGGGGDGDGGDAAAVLIRWDTDLREALGRLHTHLRGLRGALVLTAMGDL